MIAFKIESVPRLKCTNEVTQSFWFSEKPNSRIPFPPSAFGLGTLTKGISNTSQTSHSPMESSEALPLSILSNGLPVGEKSPSSSDNSMPSFGAKPEPTVPFSPFESTYLLSSINEAYARLLSRQFQSQQPTTTQNTDPNSIPTLRAISPSSPHLDISLNPLLGRNGEGSVVYRRPYSGRPNKENAKKIGDAVRTGFALPRSIPPTLSSAPLSQPRPMNPPLGSFFPQSSIKTSPDHTQVTMLNGSRPTHSYGLEKRTNPTNSCHPPVPPTSVFPFQPYSSSPAELSQLPSGPLSCGVGSAPAHPMPNPYESSFYSILGAIFVNWAQRNVDRKGAVDRPSYPSVRPTVSERESGSFASKSDINGFNDGMSPVDLVARNVDRPKVFHRGSNTAESTESNDTILSIEKLLEVPSNKAKESTAVRKHDVSKAASDESPLNQFRLPSLPFSVPELSFLSNTFTKQLKDRSSRA